VILTTERNPSNMLVLAFCSRYKTSSLDFRRRMCLTMWEDTNSFSAMEIDCTRSRATDSAAREDLRAHIKMIQLIRRCFTSLHMWPKKSPQAF
jgi:hypothetical protein